MSFSEKLKLCAGEVEARLDILLNEPPGGMPDGAGRKAPPDRLASAMRHGALGGGKRFRPFLVLETAALFGVPRRAAIAAATALECVHCYSLVHDDLPAMDDDATRRGRPTVHKAFDQWTAILAGDALLTLAFEILSRKETHSDAAIRTELIGSLARAAGWAGMAGGQQLDLDAQKADPPTPQAVDQIMQMQAMKTGALIGFACDAGAILGKAGAAERQALSLYGGNLGRAFQIADDLLDAEGDAGALGKAVGKDAAAGKATLVSLLGLGGAKAALAETEAAAIAALDIFGARAQTLIEAARFVSRRKR